MTTTRASAVPIFSASVTPAVLEIMIMDSPPGPGPGPRGGPPELRAEARSCGSRARSVRSARGGDPAYRTVRSTLAYIAAGEREIVHCAALSLTTRTARGPLR